MKKAVLSLWVGIGVPTVFFSGCRQHDGDKDRLLHTGQTLMGFQKTETERLGQSLDYLRRIVSEQGNRPSDSLLVVRAGTFRAAALQLLDRIDTLEARLVSEASGRDRRTKALLHPGDYPSVRKWQARHYRQDTLAAYLDGLTVQAAALAPGTAKDTPEFMRHAGQTLQLLADGKISAGAGVALLTALQIEIARFGAEAIQGISQPLQRRYTLATKLRPIVRQSPSHVREGDTCTVEVHLVEYVTAYGEKPLLMYANGEPVPVQNGTGKVSFIAQPPAGKRTWKGGIYFHTPSGYDTTFSVREVYHVKRDQKP